MLSWFFVLLSIQSGGFPNCIAFLSLKYLISSIALDFWICMGYTHHAWFTLCSACLEPTKCNPDEKPKTDIQIYGPITRYIYRPTPWYRHSVLLCTSELQGLVWTDERQRSLYISSAPVAVPFDFFDGIDRGFRILRRTSQWDCMLGYEAEKYTNFRHLNVRWVKAVFNSAIISEGMQLYSQI
jgi:hypothetical protein